MAKWNFNFCDNSGYFKHFYIKAATKQDAIKKGFDKAKKQSRGDIISWNCSLHSVL